MCKKVEWPVTHYQPQTNRMSMDMLPGMMPGMGNIGIPETPDKPEAEYEPVIFNPSEYVEFIENIRQYGKLVSLKARYHIIKHEYDEAVIWLRTGLNISRQMVRNSNTQLAVMAVANAATVLQQIELWVQMPNSPSLFRSLQDIPSPFLNASALSSLIQKKPKMRGMPGMMMPGMMGRPRNEEKEEEDMTFPNYSSGLFRNTADRIDRFIAILHCLEGLRYYAALYDGKLPNSLFEVTEIRLPNDPITKGQFLYHKEADVAILQTSDIRNAGSPSGFSYTIRMRPHSGD